MKTVRVFKLGLAALVVSIAPPGLQAKTLDEKLVETEVIANFGTIVAPIMTERERASFGRLTNDMQRVVFIDLFWQSRDPDPDTPVNEFKEDYLDRVAKVYKRYSKGPNAFRSHQAVLHLTLGAPHERRTVFTRRYGPVAVWTYWSTSGSALPPQYSIVFSNSGLRNILFTTYPNQTRTDRLLNSTGGTLGLEGLPYELARAVEEINQARIVNPSTPS